MIALAITLTLVLGLVIGLLHAFMINQLRLPPFIATLATMAGQRSLAAILEAEDSGDAGRIRKAYVRLYGRPATERDIRLGLAFLRTPEDAEPSGGAKAALSRWQQYAQVLLSANEFTFID